MKMKEAMKRAKATGKSQRVTEFEPVEETKVQISMRLDLDTLNGMKKHGEQMGIPYQTLINSILKQHLLLQDKYEDRLKHLEEEVKELKNQAG